MAGKKMPALFELIRDPAVNRAQKFPVVQQARKVGDPAPPPPPPPARPKIDIPPRPVAKTEPPKINLVSPPPPPPSGGAAAALPVRGGVPVTAGDKRFTITQSTLWMILAGVVVVLVIIWWSAYHMGYSKADKQALKDFGVAGGPAGVKDPLKGSDIPVNPKLVPQPPPGPKGQPKSIQNPPAKTPAGKPADTRQPGLNYCYVATLKDKDAAERAADFLTQNGVPAIVSVDTEASGAKNPGSYKVFALQGITGEEFRNRAPARTKLEAELTRLGQVYKKDPKGRVDFGQFGWEKFKQ